MKTRKSEKKKKLAKWKRERKKKELIIEKWLH